MLFELHNYNLNLLTKQNHRIDLLLLIVEPRLSGCGQWAGSRCGVGGGGGDSWTRRQVDSKSFLELG